MSAPRSASARPWHLVEVTRPTPHVCVCGRPDHQVIVRQLAEALGYDLPALAATPEQVWNGLLDEVERLAGRDAASAAPQERT